MAEPNVATPDNPGMAGLFDGASHTSGDAMLDTALAEPSTPTEPTEPSTPAAEPEPEPEWMATAPEELKGILGHTNLKAEAKKWLRDTYGELNDFRATPYGTREAMQELAQLVPGGLDDLKAAMETVREQQRVQRMIESGDPAQMDELLEERLVAAPDSFIAQLHGGIDALKRSNLTQEYDEIASTLAHDRLEGLTDGGFGKFFDGLAELSATYNRLASGTSDADKAEAQRIAGRLAGSALEVAGWWNGAKGKLGFGQAADRGGAVTSRAGAASSRDSGVDRRETELAQREVSQFNQRHADAYSRMANPLISAALKKEAGAHKLTLSEKMTTKLSERVGQRVIQAITSDPQMVALVTRVHYNGRQDDPRGYNMTDQTVRTLVEAARLRASKLIPRFAAEELADIAELTPQARQVTPGEGRTSGGSAGGGGGKKSTFEEATGNGKRMSTEKALDLLLS